jgi:hypothetical protein
MARHLRGLDRIDAAPPGERAERAPQNVRCDVAEPGRLASVGNGAADIPLRERPTALRAEDEQITVELTHSGRSCNRRPGSGQAIRTGSGASRG